LHRQNKHIRKSTPLTPKAAGAVATLCSTASNVTSCWTRTFLPHLETPLRVGCHAGSIATATRTQHHRACHSLLHCMPFVSRACHMLHMGHLPQQVVQGLCVQHKVISPRNIHNFNTVIFVKNIHNSTLQQHQNLHILQICNL
jgi:hypothetical protein